MTRIRKRTWRYEFNSIDPDPYHSLSSVRIILQGNFDQFETKTNFVFISSNKKQTSLYHPIMFQFCCYTRAFQRLFDQIIQICIVVPAECNLLHDTDLYSMTQNMKHESHGIFANNNYVRIPMEDLFQPVRGEAIAPIAPLWIRHCTALMYIILCLNCIICYFLRRNVSLIFVVFSAFQVYLDHRCMMYV